MVEKRAKVEEKRSKKSVVFRDDRSQTGIPGFDELLQGGFPINSAVSITGGPGTGKSIFCMEYLINGAKKFNEKGLYVSFEQRADAIRDQASQFGWDLPSLEKKGKVTLLSVPLEKITQKTIDEIKDKVNKEKIKRLVIDSLSTLIINAPIYVEPSELAVKDVMGGNTVFSPPIIGDFVAKRFIYSFIDQLRNLNCTTLLISEASQSGEYLTRDTLSEFVSDGVVLISFESLGGEFARSLTIRKMRQTENNEDVHPMEIGKKGVIIHDPA